jgi:hypothetical protein
MVVVHLKQSSLKFHPKVMVHNQVKEHQFQVCSNDIYEY